MKVEITKSIDIADKSPSIPIVKVVKGETRDDLSDHVANRLIELGCAKQADEKAEVKEVDNTSDNSEGDAEESADNTSTSEGDAGDTGDDNTGDQDTENTDESIDEAADESGLSATPEATPETLKAELEDIYLKEMDGPMGSEQKAKAALEEIGKRYGIDVDKRKNVDGIIETIVEAAFKVE